MNAKDKKLFLAMGPCDEGREWVAENKIRNIRELWDRGPRVDWMLWLLRQIGFEDDRKLRLYACACVRGTPLADGRTLWDLLTDERSRGAVEVAERYAEGKATEEELAAAWDVAWDVARDVAWDVAWDVARDVARAAAWAAARDVAWDVAWAAAQNWQVNLLRQWISWDEIEPVLERYRQSKA